MTQAPTANTAVPIGTEAFRPKAHFTPRRNWINDPNGLVYFEGEYHLFYQYNPEGREWGHMSWGHAVSPDLAHWEELPVAIPETDQMIFSGSIVVDRENISGLGDGNAVPLLAFYTAYDAARSIQSQHLAYSYDRGRTFVHYAGNPIIDLNHADFRDPKVFYHADSAAWIMVVALAKDHVVQFYRSTNLIDWELAGAFGPAGSTAGQWECPDLIPVPIEGESASAWVLKVDVDNAFLDGGSGTQYFVGAFDGGTFTVDPAQGNPTGDLVDYGPDFYAAITWAELPADQPGPIWIGWQSNHQSGRFYPTDPWCGAMSLPRRLFLYREGGRLRLGQVPVLSKQAATLQSALSDEVSLTTEPKSLVAGMDAFQYVFEIAGRDGGRATITIRDDENILVRMTVDHDAGHVEFERLLSPMIETREFHRRTVADVAGDTLTVQVILDGPLVEIFLNDGRLVYTSTVFPTGAPEITGEASAGHWRVVQKMVEKLQPTMFLSG